MLEYTLGSATIVMYRRAALKDYALRTRCVKGRHPIGGISSPDPPEGGIQLSRFDKVIGSDIFNIQLGSVATRSDAKGIQLGVSYYIKVTFFICLA